MYTKLRLGIFISICCLGVFGCGRGSDSQVELQNKMIAAMDDIGNTLGSIKDEKSAEAAKPKLESLVTTMNALVQQAKSLRNPSAEFKAKTLEMNSKVTSFAINASQNLKILEIIGPVMEKLMTQR